MRKSNPGLTQHIKNHTPTPEYHYVVKDWKTGTEHPFETEQEAHAAHLQWAAENKSAYRYTVYRMQGKY